MNKLTLDPSFSTDWDLNPSLLAVLVVVSDFVGPGSFKQATTTNWRLYMVDLASWRVCQWMQIPVDGDGGWSRSWGNWVVNWCLSQASPGNEGIT